MDKMFCRKRMVLVPLYVLMVLLISACAQASSGENSELKSAGEVAQETQEEAPELQGLQKTEGATETNHETDGITATDVPAIDVPTADVPTIDVPATDIPASEMPDDVTAFLTNEYGFEKFDYIELFDAISSCKEVEKRMLIAACMDKYWENQNISEIEKIGDIKYSSYFWRKAIDANNRYADESSELLMPWLDELASIDRGVDDVTIYSENEFSERIAHLMAQDQNLLRETVKFSPSGDPITAYLEGDAWSQAYANQRAYERLWSFYEKGYDLGHVRPLTQCGEDGKTWTIVDEDISDVIAYNKETMGERTFSIENENWPVDYQKYQHSENLSSDINFDIEGFEYNEYNAKYIEAKAFWGFYTSCTHYEYLLLPNYKHCAIGVSSIDKNGKRHFMVSEEFYSLNSEECDYLYQDIWNDAVE